jgi:hypothetical protein
MTDWVTSLLGKDVTNMAKIMDETFKEGSYEDIIIKRGLSALLYRCVVLGIAMGFVSTNILVGILLLMLA